MADDLKKDAKSSEEIVPGFNVPKARFLDYFARQFERKGFDKQAYILRKLPDRVHFVERI